jgi:hypothetical protein
MRKGTRIIRNGMMKDADNCWSKHLKQNHAYLADQREQREQNMRRKGNGRTQNVGKKRGRLPINN